MPGRFQHQRRVYVSKGHPVKNDVRMRDFFNSFSPERGTATQRVITINICKSRSGRMHLQAQATVTTMYPSHAVLCSAGYAQ